MRNAAMAILAATLLALLVPACGPEEDPCGKCGPDEYCELWRCDEPVKLRRCVPKPTSCLNENEPACGCDGRIYHNACEANQQGITVGPASGCTPPPGLFACGPRYCDVEVEFCRTHPGTFPEEVTCDAFSTDCGPPWISCKCAVVPGDETCACSHSPEGGIHQACESFD